MASPALADGKLLALTHPECLGTDAHNYRRWPAEALTYAAHAPVAQTARNKSWASAANRRAFRKLPTYPIFRCGRADGLCGFVVSGSGSACCASAAGALQSDRMLGGSHRQSYSSTFEVPWDHSVCLGCPSVRLK